MATPRSKKSKSARDMRRSHLALKSNAVMECPNCGEISVGYKNSSGTIKVECSKCHAVMVRKVMGRRHDRIDIYAPKGEVNETGRLAGL